MLRKWQEFFLSVEEVEGKKENEVGEEHDHLEEFEIVDPPDDSEDQEKNHGGDDVAQDVEDAPARQEAAGEPEDNLEDHLYDDPLFPDTPPETSSTIAPPESSAEEDGEGEEEEEGEGVYSLSEESEEEGEKEGEDEGAENSDAPGSSTEKEASEEDGGEISSSDAEGEAAEAEEPSTFSSEEKEEEGGEGEGEEEEEAEEEADEVEGSENSAAAFELRLEALKERRLQTALAVIFGKISEDLAGWPTEGDDEWDVQAVMERRVSKRPLPHCRQSRERERVVLVLDTSGSCSDYAEFFSRVASLAERLGSVEIHEAPNAWIDEPYKWSQFSRRTIIFLGDFDGGDCLVRASRENKLYWFSTETRYSDMLEHSWCHHSLQDFRGEYFPCQSTDDIVRLARKIR